MPSQIEALTRLFRDDDRDTVALVKEQLLLQGELAVPYLREIVNADSAIVAAHAQEVLHAIACKNAATELEALCGGVGEIPLEEACLLIAEALMPWVDTEDARRILDAWGREVSSRLTASPGQSPVSLLINYLHGELGFDGNVEEYYNHENSHLPSVLESRKGLPLTLTLIYLFVGARAGIVIHGVNLPGHFIARCEESYFDPFHSGRVLSIADCADILARQEIELSDEHLENPESRQILGRLLANLSHAYGVEEGNWQKRMVDRWLRLVMGADI